MAKSEIVNSLDIGTTKVSVLSARIDEDGSMEILGYAKAPTAGGLRKGVIINLENTVRAIETAVEQAEEMADMKIRSVITNVGGIYLKGMNSDGNRTISRGSKEITRADINNAIEASCELSIPLDQEIIFISPQEYIVDGHDGIKDLPVGILGENLGVKVHLFMGAITSMQNIFKSVNLSGLKIRNVVPSPLAASLSVVAEEEIENGVAMVDIGGGTTDIAVFVKGHLIHTHVLGLGGEQITGDIAICLRSSREVAERLKREYGSALASLAEEGQIEVPGLGGRESHKVSRSMLCEVIQARLEEILELVRNEIRKTGYEDILSAGVVLTGGVANTKGIADLAGDVMGLPVRLGLPRNLSESGENIAEISDPAQAVGMGLLKHIRLKGYSTSAKGTFFDRFKKWWKDLF